MTDKSSIRILLAEDNHTNQQLAKFMLKHLGYQADAVKNGQEVLDALIQQTYDIVLMDVHMPVMDGLEATEKIRQEFPQEKQPYIIAMTASSAKKDRDQCIDAGMNDFLSKPFLADEMEKVLDNYQP